MNNEQITTALNYLLDETHKKNRSIEIFKATRVNSTCQLKHHGLVVVVPCEQLADDLLEMLKLILGA